MTEHHTAQVNGTRLHYVTAGEGPAVVLLHGWPETSHEWRHVTDLLASDHQVVVPDLRGFGSSAKPASGYDAATIAADLAALGDHLGLSDVTVIGHDWGAVFAYVYAAKYPGQVARWASSRWRCQGSGSWSRPWRPSRTGTSCGTWVSSPSPTCPSC